MALAQPLIQWVQRTLNLEVKRLACETVNQPHLMLSMGISEMACQVLPTQIRIYVWYKRVKRDADIFLCETSPNYRPSRPRKHFLSCKLISRICFWIAVICNQHNSCGCVHVKQLNYMRRTVTELTKPYAQIIYH